MERLILQKLLNWKNSPYRKPLILKGVRQVGKTWILKEFGKRCYENTAYFNFDENEEYGYYRFRTDYTGTYQANPAARHSRGVNTLHLDGSVKTYKVANALTVRAFFPFRDVEENYPYQRYEY